MDLGKAAFTAFGSIFGRGVALSRFGADVQKLRQKFGPYMGPVATSGGPNLELIKDLKKVCPPPLKQFPNRTSNKFFLRSIFLSSMSASIKKKVSQNWTKLQQTTNNNKQQQTTTNNKQQTTIFSAKNK